MALEKPEVSSENRGPGFGTIQNMMIFTQDKPQLVCMCVCVYLCCTSLSQICEDVKSDPVSPRLHKFSVISVTYPLFKG